MHLFVYGTLRRSASHPMHRLLFPAAFVGPGGSREDFTIWAATPPPSPPTDPAEAVHGEVYLLHPSRRPSGRAGSLRRLHSRRSPSRTNTAARSPTSIWTPPAPSARRPDLSLQPAHGPPHADSESGRLSGLAGSTLFPASRCVRKTNAPGKLHSSFRLKPAAPMSAPTAIGTPARSCSKRLEKAIPATRCPRRKSAARSTCFPPA